MGDKTNNRGTLTPMGSGNCGIYIAVGLIICDLLCPHLLKLAYQDLCQVMLLCRRGGSLCPLR